MPTTETLQQYPLPTELQVFDVSLYERLFNQVIQKGLSKEEARQVVAFAATNDGVGLVTEKVPAEKNESGNYVFDVESRIRMQMTPPRHSYLQEEDGETGSLMMVAPEHKWGSFKKDALELIDNWRRGTDKVGMAGVRSVFLDQSDESLKEGETVIWGSPMAEAWEGAAVMRHNGAYGFLYVGRVTNIDGVKALEVLDFKNDLDVRAYELLYERMGEVHTDPLYRDHPLVDKVKATFVRSIKEWTVADVWEKLGEAQEVITGSGEIFNLSVESIVALQDPELHLRIRKEVASPIGEWIADEIYQGISTEVIQNQIRQKFIGETVKLIMEVKAERLQDRWIKEYTAADYINQTVPLDAISRHHKLPNLVVLARYSGSSGDGCGSWGRSRSGRGGIRSGSSSVAGLSRAFGGSEGMGGTCEACGLPNTDNHYHCPDCNHKYDDETNTERTSVCACGFEFGCGGSADKEEEQKEDSKIIAFPTAVANQSSAPAELPKAA